jgi:hypothetical protein
MKETVIFLQDLFYAHTFERYQLIKCKLYIKDTSSCQYHNLTQFTDT